MAAGSGDPHAYTQSEPARLFIIIHKTPKASTRLFQNNLYFGTRPEKALLKAGEAAEVAWGLGGAVAASLLSISPSRGRGLRHNAHEGGDGGPPRPGDVETFHNRAWDHAKASFLLLLLLRWRGALAKPAPTLSRGSLDPLHVETERGLKDAENERVVLLYMRDARRITGLMHVARQCKLRSTASTKKPSSRALSHYLKCLPHLCDEIMDRHPSSC